MNTREQEERAFVIRRDGECVLAKMNDLHVCRRMGTPHRPDMPHLLTVEHVKDQSMMGRRAPSDRKHMVAMCLDANVAVPSKDTRQWLREYLRRVNA